MRILIVGAGIAGLSAALRLRQLGLPATVVEAAPRQRGSGYMVDFFGPGVAAAHQLGLTAGLQRVHDPVGRLDFVDRTGRTRFALHYPTVRRRMFAGAHYNFLRTVRDLNTRAHAHGVLAGTVSRHGVVLHDGLTAGVGDRIVTRHNNRRLTTTHGYVRNGDLWDVTAIGHDGSLRARPAGALATAGTIRLPAGYVTEHVELGYATTTARTQGITVDETHTIATPGMAREDLYVAMSRGRALNRTYVVLDQPDPDCLPGQPATPTAREVLDQILTTSHAEATATETWETFHPNEPAPSAAWSAQATHRPQQPLAASPYMTANAAHNGHPLEW